MSKIQKFAIALIVITLLVFLRAINKSTSPPMEPRTSPTVQAPADLREAKNKILGTDKVVIPPNYQDLLQDLKKQCESSLYRTSNPDTCDKFK